MFVFVPSKFCLVQPILYCFSSVFIAGTRNSPRDGGKLTPRDILYLPSIMNKVIKCCQRMKYCMLVKYNLFVPLNCSRVNARPSTLGVWRWCGFPILK